MAFKANSVDSAASVDSAGKEISLPAWIKVSAVAGISALAGGLAAAWFYRKTLSRLQEADTEPMNSNFRIRDGRTEDED